MYKVVLHEVKNGVFRHVQNAYIQSYLGPCSSLIHSIVSNDSGSGQ